MKRKTRGKSRSTAQRKPMCGERDVCLYLEQWADYFNVQFLPYYARLLSAVCNLERVVMQQRPNNAILMICPGDGGEVIRGLRAPGGSAQR